MKISEKHAPITNKPKNAFSDAVMSLEVGEAITFEKDDDYEKKTNFAGNINSRVRAIGIKAMRSFKTSSLGGGKVQVQRLS